MQTKENEGCNLPADLEWGMIIDGKDADRGPDAYTDPLKDASDKDSFHDGPLNALRMVHKSTKVDSLHPNRHALSLKIVEKIHGECCAQYRKYRNSTHMGRTLDCIPKIEDPALRMKGTKGINKGYIKYQGAKQADGSYKSFTRGNPLPVEPELQKLIAQYNKNLKGASNSDEKTVVLANFLRNLAWLHSWTGGNGRIRNLIMQREIRHLGLGCGAMMYNNNRDIFYLDDESYARKIHEGINMYQESESLKTNAWTVQANKDRHHKDFALDPQMEEVCKFKHESLGSIE